MSVITSEPSLSLGISSCGYLCVDYYSCGQTYGGCFTACNGVDLPPMTVPAYVISACRALGSSVFLDTDQPEVTPIDTATGAVTTTGPSVSTSTAPKTQTIHTIGTKSGIVTILTEPNPTRPVSSISSQRSTISTSAVVNANGTVTTRPPSPTQSEPSAANLGKGTVKTGVVFGTVIAFFMAGVSVF
ncbi:hypothetical protein ABW20_dc0108977 [Dactylellina cionopaga]|nr:hypothetical protein ABW20_dc0108977 [Dactylellina cionopaga]